MRNRAQNECKMEADEEEGGSQSDDTESSQSSSNNPFIVPDDVDE